MKVSTSTSMLGLFPLRRRKQKHICISLVMQTTAALNNNSFHMSSELATWFNQFVQRFLTGFTATISSPQDLHGKYSAGQCAPVTGNNCGLLSVTKDKLFPGNNIKKEPCMETTSFWGREGKGAAADKMEKTRECCDNLENCECQTNLCKAIVKCNHKLWGQKKLGSHSDVAD